MDAHHMRAVLETHGIAATVMGESLPEPLPLAPGLNLQPTVWVHDEDVEHALAVLGDVKAVDTRPSDWNCPGCGETIEGHFSGCWNCGVSHPDVDTG